jgi:hypothetical protein
VLMERIKRVEDYYETGDPRNHPSWRGGKVSCANAILPGTREQRPYTAKLPLPQRAQMWPPCHKLQVSPQRISAVYTLFFRDVDNPLSAEALCFYYSEIGRFALSSFGLSLSNPPKITFQFFLDRASMHGNFSLQQLGIANSFVRLFQARWGPAAFPRQSSSNTAFHSKGVKRLGTPLRTCIFIHYPAHIMSEVRRTI